MALTYQDLLEKIYEMSPAQRKCTVCVYDVGNDETRDVDGFDVCGEEDEDEVAPAQDVLELGQPYLIQGIN